MRCRARTTTDGHSVWCASIATKEKVGLSGGAFGSKTMGRLRPNIRETGTMREDKGYRKCAKVAPVRYTWPGVIRTYAQQLWGSKVEGMLARPQLIHRFELRLRLHQRANKQDSLDEVRADLEPRMSLPQSCACRCLRVYMFGFVAEPLRCAGRA
jgi:hypothetical protein